MAFWKKKEILTIDQVERQHRAFLKRALNAKKSKALKSKTSNVYYTQDGNIILRHKGGK